VSGLRNAASLLVALVSGVAAAAQAPHTGPDADARFATVEHAYVVYSMSRFPVMATYLGGASFDPSLSDTDGMLRDASPAAIGAEDAQLRELRAQFAQLEPRHLSARRRIDRTVALAQIDFLLHQHEVLRLQQRSLDAYVEEPRRGVDWLIQGLSPGPAGAATEGQWQHVLARTRAVPAYLAMARQQLAAGVRAGHPPDWRVLAEFGVARTVADADYFSRTLPGLAQQSLGGAARESLLRPLQQAGTDAAQGYQQLHDYIVATFFLDPSGTDVKALKPQFRADRFALGESEYDWALHNNLHLETTATALYPQSWLAVQAGRAQLLGLARAIALAHHWTVPPGTADVMVRSVFEHLEQDAPPTDAALLESYARTSQRVVAYARGTHLFEVPARYSLEATLAPPPPLRIFSSDSPGRFYVPPTGDDPALLRRLHNPAAQPELAAREGFPGQDWHYRIMAENRAAISAVRWLTPGAVADSTSMWEDAASDAGWALYAQGLLAEPRPGAPHGFYSAEERLYQLRAQLDRALRVRIDTGLHTGRLSFEDAVTLMSEVVDFMPGSCHDARPPADADKRASCERARDEVRRCARWPTRAITAWLGKEQIQSLRRRAQRLFATDFSEQRFHLELMRQGPIPAGYFAEELLRNLGRPAAN
jgi:uncharacterized protein (DUF885 family)